MLDEAVHTHEANVRCRLVLDNTGYMQWGDRETSLSPAETRMVRELLSTRTGVVSRRQLALLAGTEVRRGLDAHIYRLRHKLSVFYNLELETVPKRGFRINLTPKNPMPIHVELSRAS